MCPVIESSDLKIYRLVIFLNLLIVQASDSQKNEVTLYNTTRSCKFDASNVTLSMSSDLLFHNFDDKAMSVCVSGLALFYKDRDFEGNVEYVYGPDNFCTDLKHLGVSSLRHPGFPEDISKESLTLYQGRVFTGRDYVVHGKTFHRNRNFEGKYKTWKSLIVTGGSNWTVYDDGQLVDNIACLISPDAINKTPGYLINTIEISSFGSSVTWAERGCDANSYQNQVYLSPFSKQGPA